MCAVISELSNTIVTIIGGNTKLPCPLELASGQINWNKLNGDIRTQYSEGKDIKQDLDQELRPRLHIEGRDLCILYVQKGDAGNYECVFYPKPNKVPQVYKLTLIVSKYSFCTAFIFQSG